MRPLPPLPRSVPSSLGPIPVTIVAGFCQSHTGDAEEDAKPSLGLWEADQREITVSDRLAEGVCQWQTLWHEYVHVALADGGLSSLLTNDAEEAICEAIATALVHYMLHQKGL